MSGITQGLMASFKVGGNFPSTNLISYWKLDGNSNDSKGSNNGTDTSISYITGKIGSAATLNTTSSQINMGSPSNLLISYPLTISMWAKYTSTSGDRVPLRCYNGTGGMYGFDFNSSAVVGRVGMQSYNGMVNSVAQSLVNTYNDGNWHFYVGTISSSQIISLYIDGVFQNSLSRTVVSPNGNFSIGLPGGNNMDGGTVDEVGVWNRELTSTEIITIYNSGNGLTYNP